MKLPSIRVNIQNETRNLKTDEFGSCKRSFNAEVKNDKNADLKSFKFNPDAKEFFLN